MKKIADVNVIFPLLLEWHSHHQAAWAWWDQADDRSVGLCWPVRLSVLRLLTNQKAMKGTPLTPDEALAAWTELASDPRTFWLEVVPAGHEACFQKFVTGRSPSPNLWTDAWLGALAEALQFRLTSFDADFHSFPLSDFEHLVAQ